MKKLIVILGSLFLPIAASAEPVSDIVVGKYAERILAQGKMLYISADTGAEYRALVSVDNSIFECKVFVIETIGFEEIRTTCIGNFPKD